jgi:hypothetical protein
VSSRVQSTMTGAEDGRRGVKGSPSPTRLSLAPAREVSLGRVEPETAAWLVASLSCGRPTRTTGMIARAIVREAQHCEELLLGFALTSPKHPSLSNRLTVGAEAESRARLSVRSPAVAGLSRVASSLPPLARM